MVSSELPEVMGMSDRIVVMREGRIVAVFDNDGKLEAGDAGPRGGRHRGEARHEHACCAAANSGLP